MYIYMGVFRLFSCMCNCYVAACYADEFDTLGKLNVGELMKIIFLQLYDRRLKAVREHGKEKQRYGQLSLDYMFEESSSSDEAKVIVHRPEWRSDGNVYFVSYTVQ